MKKIETVTALITHKNGRTAYNFLIPAEMPVEDATRFLKGIKEKLKTGEPVEVRICT